MKGPQGRDQTRVLTAIYEFGPLSEESIGYAIDMREEAVHRVLGELADQHLARWSVRGWCSVVGWSPYAKGLRV